MASGPAAASSASSASSSGDGFLQLQDQLETLRGENKILRQKLNSKAEALLILSKELDKARSDCDDYRELTSRLQARCSGLKSAAAAAAGQFGAGGAGSFNSRALRDQTVARHFGELRAENKRLLGEREELRRTLREKEEDVRAMRGQLRREDRRARELQAGATGAGHQQRSRETDDLVRWLETLQLKYAGTKKDLQSLLDEKEDLVQDRDAYKCKTHRLNHAMSALLKSDGFKSIDLDWLLAENKYLKESLQHVQEEKQLANEMGRRYKAALEKSGAGAKNNPPSKKKGKNAGNDDPAEMAGRAAAADQIAALIGKTSFACPLKYDLLSAESLQQLCLVLLETLGDRMLQLKHQRRANKHMLQRLAEIEQRLEGREHAGLILRPSQFLMSGYSNADVDQEELELEPGEQQQQQERARASLQASLESSSLEAPAPDATGQGEEEQEQEETTPADADESRHGGPSSFSFSENPPDIIDGVPATVARNESAPASASASAGQEKEEHPADEDDSIVLPDHLQSLVDQAMRELQMEQAEES